MSLADESPNQISLDHLSTLLQDLKMMCDDDEPVAAKHEEKVSPLGSPQGAMTSATIAAGFWQVPLEEPKRDRKPLLAQMDRPANKMPALIEMENMFPTQSQPAPPPQQAPPRQKNHGSHTLSSAIDRTKLKTKVCRMWASGARCQFGGRCAFAHGDHQLRQTYEESHNNHNNHHYNQNSHHQHHNDHYGHDAPYGLRSGYSSYSAGSGSSTPSSAHRSHDLSSNVVSPFMSPTVMEPYVDDSGCVWFGSGSGI